MHDGIHRVGPPACTSARLRGPCSLTAACRPSTATVSLATLTVLPMTPSSGIQSSNQLAIPAHGFQVSLRHGRHHANIMTSVELWPEYGGSVDEASVIHELVQPSSAPRSCSSADEPVNLTSPGRWLSSAAASDCRVVADSGDDATGKIGRRAGLRAVICPNEGRLVAGGSGPW